MGGSLNSPAPDCMSPTPHGSLLPWRGGTLCFRVCSGGNGDFHSWASVPDLLPGGGWCSLPRPRLIPKLGQRHRTETERALSASFPYTAEFSSLTTSI